MKPSRTLRLLIVGIMVAGCFGLVVSPCQAVEEARPFLEGLREKGFYDTALDYLEQMATSPLCPPEFKEAIDYEAGITLMTGSRTVRVTSVREKNLDEAQVRFKKFLSEHPKHRLASGASTQLANVLVERGRIKSEQAARPNKSKEEKQQLLTEARKLYVEAEKAFTEAEKRFLEEAKKFPKFIEKTKVKEIEARDQARRDLVQARLFLATVVYEIALTYEPGSKERNEKLQASAKRYADLYEMYGSRLAGLYARLWEGRCYKDLGDSKKALEAFDELLMQPDDPQAFRTLKNKALILALETYMLPEVKNYAEAMKKGTAWKQSARGAEESSDDGLAIQFLAAKASLAYARKLEKKDPKRQESLINARQLLQFVAKFPGDYQRQAKAELLSEDLAGKDAEVPEPTNFADARDRGKTALDRMQAADIQMRLDLEEKKKDNIKKYQAQIKEARAEATKYYRMALAMKTPETPIDDLNVIRYYLAYLYWADEDLWESAIMGEFLARRYPNSAGARQGAKIAMAAYVKLFNEAPPGDGREFETSRMVGIADYITKVWPNEPEADEAWMMLIRTAVIDGKPKLAAEYLDKIAPESPRRGEAELMTGQSLWGAYLKSARLPDDERPSQEELDTMLKEAQDTLKKGIERMRKPVDEGGEVSYTLLTAVLSLAQIYVGAGQAEEAIKYLDDPKIGPVTLVAANNPTTDRGSFKVETYKAALRSYVSAEQLDKAAKAMNALEKLVSKEGGAKGGAELTRIYISLGRQLQEQLELLRKQNKTEELGKVSKGFELFLDRISKQTEGNTFNSLSWVAETFFGMGSGFDPGGKTLPPEAKKYYQKAADTYRRILQECKAGKLKAPPGATTGLEIRLAKCLRRMGQYKEAMELIVNILKVHNLMIDAQIEAAYTYQAWGEEKAGYFPFAIKGGRKAKKKDGSVVYIVWGWGKIAKMLARFPDRRSQFHEARYNLALCRLRYALSQTGKEKSDTLKMAENDILIVERLYPDMGGAEWQGKYDKLLKQIQKLRGVKAVGLQLKSRSATGSKKTTSKKATSNTTAKR